MLAASFLAVLALTTGCVAGDNDAARSRPVAPSEGRDERVVSVPALEGVPGTRARCRVTELGLRYRYVGSRRASSRASEDVCEGRSPPPIPNPSIVSQRPRAGTRVRKGSVVVLRTRCTSQRPCL